MVKPASSWEGMRNEGQGASLESQRVSLYRFSETTLQFRDKVLIDPGVQALKLGSNPKLAVTFHRLRSRG
jgi:hypothetical protein